jgi:hypothetical protein
VVAQEEGWQLYAPQGRTPEIPELPFKIPGVWAEDNPRGLAQNTSPIVVELKPGATPVSQKQYFIPHKAPVRIQNTLTDSKMWNPPTLTVILELSLITQPETRN